MLIGLNRAIGFLPLGFHRFNARWIGWFIRNVARYRVDVVYENLRNAFPDATEEEIDHITADFYRHFATIFLESLWFGACTNLRRLRRSGIVKVANPEVLNEVFNNSPSVVVMSSHAGNWELIGGIINYPDIPWAFEEKDCCVVYRKLSSPVMNAVMAAGRIAPLQCKKTYEGYLESRQVLKFMLKHVKDHKVYDFIADQRPYFNLETAPILKFMGRDVRVMDGSARVANKLSLAVVYQRMLERPGGGYTLEYVPICSDASKMDVMDIMQRYFQLLEEDIRKQPYNYLWTHNRWWLG